MVKKHKEVVEAHKSTGYNRELLKQSKKCACCYCLKIFTTDKIDEWIDRREAEGEGQTALCPFCSVDCVLPDAAGFPLIDEFIEKMHAYWFGVSEPKK